VKIVKSPEFSKQVTRDGVEPLGTTPEEMANAIKAELAKWTNLVAEAGLRLN
jgi:tripartite-type tricarboxylate transporter receptor subunit TctC